MAQQFYLENGLAHAWLKCSLLKDKSISSLNLLPQGGTECFCVNRASKSVLEKQSFIRGLEKFRTDFRAGALDYGRLAETQRKIFGSVFWSPSDRVSFSSKTLWANTVKSDFENFLAEVREESDRNAFKAYYLGHALLFGGIRWSAGYQYKELSYGSLEVSAELREKAREDAASDYPDGVQVDPHEYHYPGVGAYHRSVKGELDPSLLNVIKLFRSKVFQDSDLDSFSSVRYTKRFSSQEGIKIKWIADLLDGLKPGEDFSAAKEVFRSQFSGLPWDPTFHADVFLDALETAIKVASTFPERKFVYALSGRGVLQPEFYSGLLDYHSLTKDHIGHSATAMVLELPDYAGDYYSRIVAKGEGSEMNGKFVKLGEVPQDLAKVTETFKVLMTGTPEIDVSVHWKAALALESKN